MLITVWDVFCAPIFQQCNPQIAAGAAGMRNAVRWAYTQERYDVTEFLVGGEILIIEGSALAEHADDEGLIAYVDALHRAKVRRFGDGIGGFLQRGSSSVGATSR